MAGDKMEFVGVVEKALGNGNFRVNAEGVSVPLKCTLSGKIRKNTIRIIEGDSVRIEVSPYDISRGVIVYRLKSKG